MLLICAMYPNIMGFVNMIMDYVDNKIGMEFKWEIEFLQLLVAGLPYRLLYFEVDDWATVIPILIIKFAYKGFIYVVYPINYEKIKGTRLKFNIKIKKMCFNNKR